MSKTIMIKAWKDPSFRAGLSPSQRSSLPSNPAGARTLQPNVLARPADPGDRGTSLTNLSTFTIWCCDPTAASVC